MRAVRARLICVALATLMVQVAGLAIAPAALCCLAMKTAQVMPCCKDAGPGHVCPLMKKKTGTETGASLRPCCSPEQQVFTALFGFLGVPALSAPALMAPPAAIVSRAVVTGPLVWRALVESPPPRV